MAKFKLEDLYTTTTTSTISSSTTDWSFSVSTPPQWTWGYIEVSPNDLAKREKFKYYNVSGNTIFYRGVDRPTPIQHSPWALVVIKDFAFFFNHLNDLIWEQFKIEKKWWLSITIWGGKVKKADNSLVDVSDTDITLTSSNTNYIYFDTTDNTLKASVDIEDGYMGWIIWQAITDASSVISITSYTTKYVWGWNKIFNTSTNLKNYNTGAFCANLSGSATFTLPPAIAWLWFDFLVGSANTLTISANWTDTIRHESTTGATLSNNTQGETISLKCFWNGVWAVASLQGTWNLI